MIIHGRECGFRFTVRAAQELAELCPDKDIAKLGELFDNKTYPELVNTITQMAIIFNMADEEARAFNSDGEPRKPLTREEIMVMSKDEFAALQKEVLRAYGIDTKRTVEVEPSKKNGAGKKKSGKSSSTGHGSASTEASST